MKWAINFLIGAAMWAIVILFLITLVGLLRLAA